MEREIEYCPVSHLYAMRLGAELVGYAPTMRDAERALDDIEWGPARLLGWLAVLARVDVTEVLAAGRLPEGRDGESAAAG